jgi:hypothetical protein
MFGSGLCEQTPGSDDWKLTVLLDAEIETGVFVQVLDISNRHSMAARHLSTGLRHQLRWWLRSYTVLTYLPPSYSSRQITISKIGDKEVKANLACKIDHPLAFQASAVKSNVSCMKQASGKRRCVIVNRAGEHDRAGEHMWEVTSERWKTECERI